MPLSVTTVYAKSSQLPKPSDLKKAVEDIRKQIVQKRYQDYKPIILDPRIENLRKLLSDKASAKSPALQGYIDAQIRDILIALEKDYLNLSIYNDKDFGEAQYASLVEVFLAQMINHAQAYIYNKHNTLHNRNLKNMSEDQNTQPYVVLHGENSSKEPFMIIYGCGSNGPSENPNAGVSNKLLIVCGLPEFLSIEMVCNILKRILPERDWHGSNYRYKLEDTGAFKKYREYAIPISILKGNKDNEYSSYSAMYQADKSSSQYKYIVREEKPTKEATQSKFTPRLFSPQVEAEFSSSDFECDHTRLLKEILGDFEEEPGLEGSGKAQRFSKS